MRPKPHASFTWVKLFFYSQIQIYAFSYFVKHTTLDIQWTFASKYAIKTILGHFDRLWKTKKVDNDVAD